MTDRYARHHLLEGWDQRRLTEARILVAGVGAVGNEVVKLLALMGVGHLLLVDFDTIELSNLTRSVLFRDSDIGQSKAKVAARRAQELNPDVTAQAIQGNLEFEVGLGVYRAQDVVIGCLDSLNARLALNRACYRAGVPWINTGIEATVAEIALFQSEKGACFECAMSESMWERRNQSFSCGGLRSDLPENAVPTTATVASLTAALAVNEALLLLHGRKEHQIESGLAFSQKLYVTLMPYGIQVANLPENPDCLAHDLWGPVTVLTEVASALTARQLLAQAGMAEGVVELGYDLLTLMRCLNCGAEEEILRPLEASSLALNHCPHCGEASRQPEILNWLEADSELAQRPLSELHVPEYQILALKDAEQRRYFQISGPYGYPKK